MPIEEPKTVEDYERLLADTLGGWSAERRTALASASAERWLPAYEAFSKTEDWGDPVVLRQALDAVWEHLQGRPLEPMERARHLAQLREHTPHMDDFDANEALCACVMVVDALRCCESADNLWHAQEAVESGFDAVVPGWSEDEDLRPRLWRRAAARKELPKQVKLLERIGAVERFDSRTVAALRRDLRKTDLVGTTAARKAPSGPPLVSNQTLFQQYRRMIEADLRGGSYRPDPDESPAMFATALWMGWGPRYSRRRQTIDGSYGQPADKAGMRAAVARALAHDSRETEMPSWQPEVRQWMELALTNAMNLSGGTSPAAPHAYGPSLRTLWMAAKRRGESDREALESVTAWGLHRPAAWEAEDRRKKKHSPEARAAVALAVRLARELTWTSSGDLDEPWVAEVDGQRWRVRVNDFPDAVMYSLSIDGELVGDFHDWPKRWRRDE